MSGSFRSLAPLACLLLPTIIDAQEEALPRVLILGDSVYRQPAADAAKELQGRAKVVYATLPAGKVFHTAAALEDLDTLLGDGDWNVIHFNFGLGDLVHRAPKMRSFRLLPMHAGGVRTTPPAEYEKNLRQLVKRLKATNAKLIWASTTPIRHSSTNVFALGSEIEYNAIAARVMAENGVPVNDMYSHVVKLIDMKRPASHGADPFSFDRQPLHPTIVRSILAELGAP